MPRPAASFPPRLMPAPAAAHYLGVSESKFRLMGIPPKVDGGNVLWERADLDDYADHLPYRGEAGGNGEADSCAGKFGRAR